MHVVIMIYPKAVRGDFESLIDLCIYTAMFGIYLGLRFEKGQTRDLTLNITAMAYGKVRAWA